MGVKQQLVHEIFSEPMTCKVYKGKPLEGSWWVEPKLDGLRGLIVVEKGKAIACSRKNKPLWNIDHILKEAGKLDDCILDGEFYANDWNSSIEVLKKQSEHPNAKEVFFYAWDLLAVDSMEKGEDLTPLLERRAKLDKAITKKFKYIKVINKISFHKDYLEDVFEAVVQDGYEGIVIKEMNSGYCFGHRSKEWLKYKPWHDVDLEIVGAKEGLGKHAGRLGALVLKGKVEDKDVEVEVGTGFIDEQREEYWKLWLANDLIGKIAEIKYATITVENSLRFPVFHRLRKDL